MGRLIVIVLILVFLGIQYSFSQQVPKPEIDLESLIERLFPIPEEDVDYERIYEVLLQLYLNPINLNKANYEALQAMYLLTPSQIDALLIYRSQFGDLLSLYELQAIPEFDSETINRIIPFVTLEDGEKRTEPFWKRLRNEEQTYLIVRHRRVWEKRKGFSPTDTSSTGRISSRYLGDPNDLYLRFRTQHSRDFSFGFTLDKDAGEQFTWDHPSRRYGFNFFSFHFQRYQVGKWKTLALGDFQASFGQGLVFGAGYTLGKGAETVPTIRRSSVGILPYTASLEWGFFRGGAATYQHKNWEFTALASSVPRDGRSIELMDSLETENFTINSFNQSGLHRTPSEISTKNQFREYNIGTAIQFQANSKLRFGSTFLYTQFSQEWIPTKRLYNQFEFQGQSNHMGSLYFNYNWKNFLFFGESALSKSGGNGSVLGLIASLSSQVDISMLWRNYDKNFHSFYGNAFAESSRPINERGIYFGLEIRPIKKWKFNAYYDFFRFPWLKYRLYNPSFENEWLSRLSFQPSKSLQVFLQYRQEQKDRNLPDLNEPQSTYQSATVRRQNGLFNLDYRISKNLFIRSRVWWSQVTIQSQKRNGLMVVQDIRLDQNRWKITARYALFDTDDYDSRIYAFENHVLWTFSIPAFSGQGQRYYLIGEYDVSRKLRLYFRWARTTYIDREKISSGLQEIKGNRQSETTLLLRYYLNR
ncbi:ComEA family DNA-binding protein [Algoriphagus limi]|uniref:Helix-hairpin-helix domain-containing protein n=1 Tax=Algoriphagus limi TaxID=2975273 RepID=A0ABT2G1H3_9BACT|nr:helix-hairpin-helix domain-containing protein [Algoriphagus limi]MCS5489125.1 helix-hairpin-helix domain-containing protein [Algoriphagus limi]